MIEFSKGYLNLDICFRRLLTLAKRKKYRKYLKLKVYKSVHKWQLRLVWNFSKNNTDGAVPYLGNIKRPHEIYFIISNAVMEWKAWLCLQAENNKFSKRQLATRFITL